MANAQVLPVMQSDWKKEMTAVAVIYYLLESGKDLSALLEGDDTFLEPILDALSKSPALVELKGSKWVVTNKGLELRKSMCKIFDSVRQFEPLKAVFLTRNLTEDERHGDTDLMKDQVADNLYDPRIGRFEKHADGSETLVEESGLRPWDMRLAVIIHLAEKSGKSLDPRRIVFIQKLIDGEFQTSSFWFDLRAGVLFEQVEEIVTSAYQWREISPGNEQHADEVTQVLYKAAMLEQRKREGNFCKGCDTPLAMYEYYAKQDGRQLTECPNPECGRQFGAPPPPDTSQGQFGCPNCQSAVYPSDRLCQCCGSIIDFSLAPGQVESETTPTTIVETTPVWGGSFVDYGYVSVGWLDPFEPYCYAGYYDVWYEPLIAPYYYW